MIEGRLHNYKVIAKANINQIIQQEISEQQKQLETKSNKVRDQNNLDYLISLRQSKNRDHPIFSQASIIIQDDLGQIKLNNQLIKPSYLLAVQNIPLPSKELEEKILANQRQKLKEYQDIQQIVSAEMFISGINDENPNPVYAPQNTKLKVDLLNIKDNNDNNNKKQSPTNKPDSQQNLQNKNGYFFMPVQKQNNEVMDFMNFAEVQDKNLAEKYVKMFPGNVEKQVQEFQNDKKREDEYQNNISIFKSKTDASGAVAIQYINQYKNAKDAIQAYQKRIKEEEKKEAIIEFENMKQVSYLIAEQYITDCKTLAAALEKYDQDQINNKNNLITQMQYQTGLDKAKAEFFLEMTCWDVGSACRFYQEQGE